MDKSVLRKFAIESRQELMEKIANKIKKFCVNEEFQVNQNGDIYVLSNDKHSLLLSKREYKNRQLLIDRINEVTLEQVIEESAYTWFNRIIAIRYMEIHDYLPLSKTNQSLGIRVLSSKDNTPDPEIMKIANLLNQDLDIEFDKDYYSTIQDDNKKFEYILFLVCDKLAKVIPQVFAGVTDYIDILIPDNLLNESGYISKLLRSVPEDNFNEVEIIGWLYQYYNQAEKDRVIDLKEVYKKNEIPYATQLFTTDWIVRYMVENSLGKYWIEHNGKELSENLAIPDIKEWKYLIKDNIKCKKDIIKPTEITFLDPCCGSGHILVYAFELLYKIYQQAGYNQNDIPELILKNNLFGLDIDDRAGQLSILSVILKAREYDRNIFQKEIVQNLNILSIQESNLINTDLLNNLKNKSAIEVAKGLIDNFKDAKEIGSLILLEEKNYDILEKELIEDESIFGIELKTKLLPLIKIAKVMEKKYYIVVTNPPYLPNKLMCTNLKKYVEKNYKSVKGDLFSSFIVRNIQFSNNKGYMGFMTPYVWMYIDTYESLRNHIIDNFNISSLVQPEYSAFEEATVPICTFVLDNDTTNNSYFVDLSEYTGGMKVQEREYLNSINENKNIYIRDINIFKRVKSSPILYSASDNIIDLFANNPMIGDKYNLKVGIQTGNNDKFLRLWHEVEKNKIQEKWFYHNKAGEFRKWYGNRDYLINYSNNAYELKHYYVNGKLASRPQNLEYNFRKSISWNLITSGTFSTRYFDETFTFNVVAPCCFPSEDELMYILGLFNTKIVQKFTKMLNPTLSMKVGDIFKIPLIIDGSKKEAIDKLVEKCISLSKEDWDNFENSWDFKSHPLINKSNDSVKIEEMYKEWEKKTYNNFELLKKYEEELNAIFIEIYNLQNELDNTVTDNNITIRKADKERDIKSLISYAVGCMFGRYSLDEEGVVFAGGKFEKDRYEKYKPQEDNIIPITTDKYFENDIVARFIEFIEIVYGKEKLYENLEFIAEALGKRNGEGSEETIRRYFINDFYNDHIKIYQKRPIYWLVDSGKKNGFKCLIYMHRYNDGVISKVRLNYLHKIQSTYEKILNEVNTKLSDDISLREKRQLTKTQTDITAKQQELKEFYEKVAHIADQRIKIDLDDGVLENYKKFSVKNPKTGKDENIFGNAKKIIKDKKEEE